MSHRLLTYVIIGRKNFFELALPNCVERSVMMTDTAGVYVGGLAYQCTYTPYSKEQEVAHVFFTVVLFTFTMPTSHVCAYRQSHTQREERLKERYRCNRVRGVIEIRRQH
jgi:hypothetical protein